MRRRHRHIALLCLLHLAAAVLLARVAYLQLYEQESLEEHGDARALRVMEVPAIRGMIADRRGEPLAISTPVHSIWATPRELLAAEDEGLARLAQLLNTEPAALRRRLQERIRKDFVYLHRGAEPDFGARVMALGLRGVSVQREYRRYYPAGEVTAQLLGFTDIDDRGQEGIELQHDDRLRGRRGVKRVLRDRLGQTVKNIETVRAAAPGRDLTLAMDRRLQYLAHRELKTAVAQRRAAAGTLVMVDPDSGEVLAMANQPSYNPNNRQDLERRYHRNISVTDSFEPGSTIKPFTALAALLSGSYLPASRVDTAPGTLRVGGHTIRDRRNYGVLDLTHVLANSSNVGISKIALSLPSDLFWRVLNSAGFGSGTGSGFPGEFAGRLNHYAHWSRIEQATVAYGYGISATALQLARAYSLLATDGWLPEIRLERLEGPPKRRQLFPAAEVAMVRAMLEEVVQQPAGTGKRAAVNRYRVAGKTGTVRKNSGGNYEGNRHQALFVGMAPASDPRLVMAVVIDEPAGEEYYGSQVAAPVFSKVMEASLRLLNVPPDNLSDLDRLLVERSGRAPAEAPDDAGRG